MRPARNEKSPGEGRKNTDAHEESTHAHYAVKIKSPTAPLNALIAPAHHTAARLTLAPCRRTHCATRSARETRNHAQTPARRVRVRT